MNLAKKSVPVPSKPKDTIFDEYLTYYNDYKNKYVTPVIVLMMCGDFYECYSLLDMGPDLQEISDITNIRKTSKQCKTEFSEKINMLGAPVASINRFIGMLTDERYTVILVDQIDEEETVNNENGDEIIDYDNEAKIIKDKKHKSTGVRKVRKVTNIITASTYINSVSPNANNLMVIFVEINKSISSAKKNYSAGISIINTISGEVQYNEIHATCHYDELVDDLQQMYNSVTPSELIMYEIDETVKDYSVKDFATDQKTSYKLINKLVLTPNQVVLRFSKIHEQFYKIPFQTALFAKVFTNVNLISPIEAFDLDKLLYATISLVISFEYIYQQNPQILKGLKNPVIYNKHKYMILYNNAQYQLNVLDFNKSNESHNKKNRPLVAIIDNCCTPMGKRELKTRLSAPFISTEKIEEIYNYTSNILATCTRTVNNTSNNNTYHNNTSLSVKPITITTNNLDLNSVILTQLRSNLKDIDDIERTFKKIIIGIFTPCDIQSLYYSFSKSTDIIRIYQNNPIIRKDLFKTFDETLITQFYESITELDNLFIIEKLSKNIIESQSDCYYKQNVHPDVDKQVLSLEKNSLIDDFTAYFNTLDSGISLIVKHNKTGHYLQTTRIKGIKLEEIIKKNPELTIKISNTCSIKKEQLKFEFSASATKITCDILNSFSTVYDYKIAMLNKLCKKYLIEDLSKWLSKYSNVTKLLCQTITIIDYVTNNAYNSIKFGYMRPTIVKGTNLTGFIDCKEIRHPIIEQLNQSEYITNDLIIDESKIGNLIFGINSSGKSSLIKAVALNIIMAQCGLFVAAKQFNFSIFTKIFTRISSDDNLYNGESSFIVETKQIASIIKKTDKTSLIIADEMCKSTDFTSALSIVLSTIIDLCNAGVPFLFSSHLHEIPNFEKIKKLTNLEYYHLTVDTIVNNGVEEIIFNRKLKKGVLENNCGYGITVSKYIIQEPNFINQCLEFKEEILALNGIHGNLVSTKKSKYHGDLIVDHCYICGSKNNLEVHHIIHQEDYRNGVNEKIHIAKNSLSNLAVLCETCHDKHHDGKISINGFIDTIKGRKLDVTQLAVAT